MCFAHATQTHNQALLKAELLTLKRYLCFGNELSHLNQKGCSKASSIFQLFL